jgi:hypothetical protein
MPDSKLDPDEIQPPTEVQRRELLGWKRKQIVDVVRDALIGCEEDYFGCLGVLDANTIEDLAQAIDDRIGNLLDG